MTFSVPGHIAYFFHTQTDKFIIFLKKYTKPFLNLNTDFSHIIYCMLLVREYGTCQSETAKITINSAFMRC